MAPTTTTATLNVSGIVVSAGTLCPFDVTLDATQSSTQTTFYDSSGLISRRITTGVEQDTYSANGKTLIGDPYHFNFIGDFVDGVRVDAHSTGIVQKVPLPGGGLFIVAGRLDTFNNIGGLALTVRLGERRQQDRRLLHGAELNTPCRGRACQSPAPGICEACGPASLSVLS